MRTAHAELVDLLYSPRRQPVVKIYAWDPTAETISNIVSQPHLSSAVATPLDLTPWCSDISWANDSLGFTLVDPGSVFHPDTGAYRAYIADGAVIRLVEGDASLDESHWLVTFTGLIMGQIGWSESRQTKKLTAKIKVKDRAAIMGYSRRSITSPSYTVGTDLGVPLYEICDTFMGISAAEIRIPAVVGRVFQHQKNQVVQMAPWEALGKLLEVVGYVPFFDGEGKLAYIDKNLNRGYNLAFPDGVNIVENSVPERSQDNINRVNVTFLDSTFERVNGDNQQLGTAQVTTGFFSLGEKLPCWWSTDHSRRADATYMVVKKSVNSGILPVGSESYEQLDNFHGQITITISVWVPILATVMIAEYIASAFIPDDVVVGGFAGVTVPVGRVVQAQSLIVMLMLMMSIGSAQYELWGTPYEYAYIEKKTYAIEDGLEYWEEKPKEINNDFLGTWSQADAIAILELTWEKCASRPRRLIIPDDLRLELGDILLLPDGRKIVITGLSKAIKRGEVPQLTVDGYKVMKS